MKTILVIIVLFISQLATSQNKIEDTIKVSGVCTECKERIENAAYIKGVKFAEWNKETGDLFVVYTPDKTTKEKIEKSIAATGHRTENMEADKNAYKQLPECCKYDHGVHKH